MKDWEASRDLPALNKPKIMTTPDSDDIDDMKGRIVTRNRQIAYMQPISKDNDLNVSLGLGKPQMRNLHGKGQSAILTVGENPGDRKNFAGLQLSQPLSGQDKKPGISAVFRKQF